MLKMICSRPGMLTLSLALAACASKPSSGAPSAAGPSVELQLPSDAGALVSVPIPAATVTIVDAFAPTCAPCKDAVPELLRHREQLASQGITIVLVAVLAEQETTEEARAALQSWGVDSGFLIDRGDRLATDLGIRELPGSVVLDQAGNIRWASSIGSTPEDVVRAAQAAAR